jgi:internalin A
MSYSDSGYHAVEAKRRIRQARWTRAQMLDLSGLGLTELPAEIGRLTKLQNLYLHRNQLTGLPKQFSRLTNLQALWLLGNRLTELPPELGQLTNLRVLELGENRLTELPTWIGRLANLVALHLHDNRLTGLPAELGHLPNLQSLALGGNPLALPTSIGQLANLTSLNLAGMHLTRLPAELGQLTNLESLELADNQLTELPVWINRLANLWKLSISHNRLTALPVEIGQLTNLRSLILVDNRLTALPAELGQLTNLKMLSLGGNQLTGLPAELGQLTNIETLYFEKNPLGEPLSELARQGTQAVLAYLRSLLDAEARYEAKLLLVGEARAGKTTLVARLRGEPFLPERSSTHGIELARLRMGHPGQPATMTLHTWDFGGQDLYQATHQLFLTRQALYLLVWNPGRDSPSQVEAWLRRVRMHVGDQARVLLVATHADEQDPVLDYADLQERFGSLLTGAFAVDNDSGAGLAAIRAAIAEQAARLPQMGEPLSENWVRAREQLLSQPVPQLSYQDYLAICTEQGIDDQEQAEALLGLLHARGQLIHYARDPWLRDIVVLQPEWLTKAISYVLNDPVTKTASGVLEHARLRELWQPYPAELHAYLLRLMEQFDVSYRLDDEYSKRSLVGQLVPADRPPREAFPRQRRGERVVSLRCALEEEPPGLMAWLIVRNHHYASGWYWQRGVLLEHSKVASRALLELLDPEPGRREGPELALTVHAPAPDYFFHVLVDSVMALLRHRWPGLGYQLRVPCRYRIAGSRHRCPGWFELEALRQQRTNGIPTVKCKACGRTQNTGLLLTGLAAAARHGRKVDHERDEQLYDLEDRLMERIDERLTTTERRIAARIAEAAEKVRRQLRRWTRLYEESEGCPRLFTLTPLDKHGTERLAIGRDVYELTLWCEYLDQPHPWPNARYEVGRTADWLRTFGPHALRVLDVLRLALQLTVPGMILAGGADYKAVVERLDAMGKLLSVLPTRLPDQPADPGQASQAESAEGAGLRALRALLDSVDPDRHYGGLEVAHTPAEDAIWLCPAHHRHYHPGRPSQPLL